MPKSFVVGLLICYCCFVAIGGQQQENPATSIHQGCNETIRDSYGFILSPHYPQSYDPNTHCEYKVVAEEGRNIELSFKVFDVEQTGGCRFDKVEVFNGWSGAPLKLGAYCGSFRPANVISTTNKMMVRFTSDTSRQGFGFMATFNSVEPTIAEPGSCGGLMLGERGDFTSVNFPKSNYPNDMTCVWHIRAPVNREVVLRFGKFHVEYSEGCTYDVVTVSGKKRGSDDYELLGKYCKLSQVPSEIVSSGNEMYIAFSTDSSGNDVGFSASYFTRPVDLFSISRGVDDIEKKLHKLIPTTTIPTTTLPTTTTPTTTIPTTTTVRTTKPPPTTQAPRRTTAELTTTNARSSCSCPTPPALDSTQACQSNFYAIYGRVGRVRQREGEPLRVLVVTQKVLKSPKSWVIKRKSRITFDIDCPECYPTMAPKGKILITGVAEPGSSPTVVANPHKISLYNRKSFKQLKKLTAKCRRSGSKNKKRKKRNRSRRNHKKD